MRPKKRFAAFAVLILALSLLTGSIAAAQDSKKILILPFHINSQEDLSFLKKGIGQMLASRLNLPEKAIPVFPENPVPANLNQNQAMDMANKLGCDYILMGTMTVFGESISTDGIFIDAKTGESIVSFNKFGESQGEAIAHVNLFASQVAHQVFGYTIGSFQTGSAGLNLKASRPVVPMWKSKTFRSEITSFSIADTDGDKKQETVMIDTDSVYVYRYMDQAFARIAQYRAPRHLKLITVDAVDVDKDGKAEIFVTAQSNSTKKMSSFALVQEGKNLSVKQDGMSFHFRAVAIGSQSEKVLMGQKAGSGKRLFVGVVHEIVFSDGSYKLGEVQSLPRNTNVYSFAYGDIRNDGSELVLSISDSGKMKVSEQSGKAEWTSGRTFGGNPTHIDFNPVKDTQSDQQEFERFYIPQRLVISDIDKDGKTELVTVKNQDAAADLFERFKSYKYGNIEFFNWNVAGPMSIWKTQKTSGHISDMTVADMNNDGRDELIYTVVKKGSNSIGTSKRSYIMFQEPLENLVK